ncbi:serine/threonine protein kinase, partial [bacterium]|nr:serine/threonine protein kinase [bacterium]
MAPSFGPYELEAQIGRGSMGRVYKARHKQTGIVRAIKVLDGNVDAEGLARFRRETAALARLSGEGVVGIHDAGSEGGRLFYVMDFCPGGSLHEKLRPGMPMPWREAVAIVAKLARGLARCHEQGFVHRDVKPANVLFDDAGNPCLADFGLCRDLFADKLTITGSVVGTPAYMAPEQLQGKKADGRSDVFGLGVVLYELVGGQRPYAGMSWNELLEGALKNERRSTQELVGAPREVDEAISRALQPDPARRYESAASFAKDLEALLRPKPSATPSERRTAAKPIATGSR